MPATDSSAVQITINVVDGNSGEVINKVTKNLNDFGSAGAGSGKKVAEGFNAAGEAGTKAGQKISQGMDGAKGHITTSLDSVRLLSQEFGFRLPRALESMLARIPAITNALSGFLGVMAGIAAAEVFVRVAQEGYKLYEQYISLNAEADKFYETLKKTSQVDFNNTHSLETSQVRQGSAQRTYGTASGVSQSTRRSAFESLANGDIGGAVGSFIGSHDIASLGVQAGERILALSKQELDQQHQIALARIEADHASDSEMGKRAQITAELSKQVAIAKENSTYSRKVEMSLGNGSPSNAGDALADQQSRDARAKASAEIVQLDRHERDERIAAQNAAVLSGLDGDARYEAERKQAIDAITRKEFDGDITVRTARAETASISEKFDNERDSRIAQQNLAAMKMLSQAKEAGLKGLAANDAQHNAGIENINTNRTLDPTAAATERQAAAVTWTSKNQEIISQYNDRLAQMDAARSDRYESENQRIQSAANRTVSEITRAWTETYGQLDAMDQRRVQSQQALNAEITKIQQDAARQKQEAGQKLEDQTEKMEAAGTRGGQNRDKERTQEIIDEYNERYQQLEELRAQDADNADKYRRQEIAAEEIKNGKLVDQQREMRDRLAGKLKGFLTNPLQELQKQGEEAASKIAASFLLKMKDRTGLSGGYGDPGIGGVHGGVLGGLGSIFNPKGHAGSTQHTVSHTASISAASSTMNATNATINVQNAMFSGGGQSTASNGGGSFAGGGFSGFGGSGGGSFGGSVGGAGDSVGPYGGRTGSGADGASLITEPWLQSGATRAASGPGAVSDISSTVSALPDMANSANTLGKELGAKGNITSKVPGLKKLGLGGNSGSDGAMGKLGGIGSGALGLFSAFKSNGGVGGAFQGALGGAKIGAEIGGPIGAAIGAIGGAVFGFLGFGGRKKAEDYDKHQVRKRIADDLQAYEAGAMDYQTAFDDFDALSREAKITTRQWGSAGKDVYNDSIKGEITAAQTRLTREQKAGRSEFGMTAAQFHNGGFINGFGSMGTNDGQGWIHAQQGEFMLNQQAAMSHTAAAQLINSGASHSQMAAYYGANKAPVASSGGGDVNLHFHSHDSKGAYQLFMDNKHHIRAALNQSYAENSGGADFA